MKQTKSEPSKHIIDVLFVLALFAVFAASALMIVSIGANVYKRTVTNMDLHYSERTAFSYVIEKIRQADIQDAILLDEIDDIPALIITEENANGIFCTYLYMHDGYLRELYVRKDSFAGEDIFDAGQKIMKLESFEIKDLENNLFKLTMDIGSGDPVIVYISPRSDKS